MSLTPHSHRVAVNAYLINEDRFLLLKRAKKPFIWGPVKKIQSPCPMNIMTIGG